MQWNWNSLEPPGTVTSSRFFSERMKKNSRSEKLKSTYLALDNGPFWPRISNEPFVSSAAKEQAIWKNIPIGCLKTFPTWRQRDHLYSTNFFLQPFCINVNNSIHTLYGNSLVALFIDWIVYIFHVHTDVLLLKILQAIHMFVLRRSDKCSQRVKLRWIWVLMILPNTFKRIFALLTTWATQKLFSITTRKIVIRRNFWK